MASKPFYSIEEVCEKLGKTEDDVKGLVRAGALREFRDAGKVFFKSDDIDKLAGGGGAAPASGESDEILLEPSSEDAVPSIDELPGLSDSSGGTSIIGLEPIEGESDAPAKSDTAITSSGVGVFDDDELEMAVDPMADTQITEGASEDQVSLEGAGSGSGLLDLAREADDTALGADLLDEIYPGEDEEQPEAGAEKEPEAEAEAEAEEEAEEEAALEAPAPVVAPPTVSAAAGDPSEGSFSGLMVGSLILMAVACTVLAGTLQGFLPDFGFKLSDGNNFYYFLGGSALTVAIALLVGWLLSRAFAPRRK